MNTIKKSKAQVSILLSFAMVFGFLGLFAVATPASALTCNSATLTGTVITGTPPAQAHFEYSSNSGGGGSTGVQTFNQEGSFPIEAFISGLAENTTYTYELVVTNSFGTAHGGTRSFTTPSCAPPPPQTCQDPAANNYGGPLPCQYTLSICKDPKATNYGGPLPCRYAPTTCQDPNATNYGGPLPCRYAPQTCQDHNATNYGGPLPCRYPPPPPQTCQDYNATNFGGPLPCRYPPPPPQTCQDHNATNYGGPLPCRYPPPPPQTCQDYNATNFGGPLPCRYPPPVQPPTVNISANPSNVNYNGTSTITWTSYNATSCNGTGGVNGWAGARSLSGSFYTGPLTATTTFGITCTNNSGQQASDSVTVYVNSQPPQTCQDPRAINYGGQLPCRYQAERVTVNIRADDTSIDSGDSTIVRWSSTNADSCRASGGSNGWSGERPTSGSFNTGSLRRDTTYSITCENENGSADANDSVTVRVEDEEEDEPTVNIFANPSSVPFNGSSTITWNSNNADSCRASGGVNGWSGPRSRSGSFFTGNLTNSTTFSISCENDSGSAFDSTTVTVGNNNIPVNNQPTVTIFADSTNIAFNGSTTVRWSTANATSCFASGGSVGWAGPKSIGPGSFFTGSLTGTRTYTITCSNDAGSATDSVTVSVRGQVLGTTTVRQQPSSLVLVTSSVDRNRPIVPTLDNTNPCPGDEINYTITYQNIGNASITNLNLRVDLPLEVDYMFSNPNNPVRAGQTLLFNLGTLRANGQGTVTIRVRVRDDVPAGAMLNFPAVLSYTDPSGFPNQVTANVSANVCGLQEGVALQASVFGAGFLPNSVFGWLLLLILILVLVLLAKHLLGQTYPRRTVIMSDHPLDRAPSGTTTIHQ